MSSKPQRFHHIRALDGSRVKRRLAYWKVLNSASTSNLRPPAMYSWLTPTLKTSIQSVRVRSKVSGRSLQTFSLSRIEFKPSVHETNLFGHFLVGDYEASSNFTLLQEYEVYGILLLGQGPEPYYFPWVKGGYKRLLLSDFREDILLRLAELKQFFQALLNEGNVLIMSTNGRAECYGTIVAFLMTTYKQSTDQAAGIVKALDPQCRLTPAVYDGLKRLEYKLRKSN